MDKQPMMATAQSLGDILHILHITSVQWQVLREQMCN